MAPKSAAWRKTRQSEHGRSPGVARAYARPIGPSEGQQICRAESERGIALRARESRVHGEGRPRFQAIQSGGESLLRCRFGLLGDAFQSCVRFLLPYFLLCVSTLRSKASTPEYCGIGSGAFDDVVKRAGPTGNGLSSDRGSNCRLREWFIPRCEGEKPGSRMRENRTSGSAGVRGTRQLCRFSKNTRAKGRATGTAAMATVVEATAHLPPPRADPPAVSHLMRVREPPVLEDPHNPLSRWEPESCGTFLYLGSVGISFPIERADQATHLYVSPWYLRTVIPSSHQKPPDVLLSAHADASSLSDIVFVDGL